ncbi:DMT family transporter [Alicyclobacillus sp. SO9]|uniref:DMT family transporter n=1 Tax=Alicyclobacillus sp. SO9 TaxID=2665646 RepID=UPI0018E77D58|nr:DMT family transporter [Alicyclobacillus sp. SO9]QQE77478.1 DMT family transporter [Alicyclobacillus sp. SO9]
MIRSTQAFGIIAVLIANLIWSGSFPATAIATKHIPPMFLTMVRLGTGALILVPFLRLPKDNRWDKTSVGLAFLLGGLGFTVPVYLETKGLALSTPALAAISISMEPLFTAIVAAVMLHERVPWRRRLALFIAFLGAWAIADFPRPGKTGYLTGDLLLLMAVSFYGFYNAFSRRLIERVPASAGAAGTLLTGFLVSVPAWFFTGAKIPQQMTSADWMSLLYLAIISTGAAYLLWMLVLQRIQVSVAALFLYLQPVFGVVLSVVMVGTRPSFSFYIGAVLILLAIFLGRQQARDKAPPQQPNISA